MLKNDQHCQAHSGLVTDLEYIKKSQDAISSAQRTINQRILWTMLSMIGTLSIMLLNFTIKYYQPAKAVAEELVK